MLRHFNNKEYWGSSSVPPPSQKIFFFFFLIKKEAGMCVQGHVQAAVLHTLPAPPASATATPRDRSGEPRAATGGDLTQHLRVERGLRWAARDDCS